MITVKPVLIKIKCPHAVDYELYKTHCKTNLHIMRETGAFVIIMVPSVHVLNKLVELIQERNKSNLTNFIPFYSPGNSHLTQRRTCGMWMVSGIVTHTFYDKREVASFFTWPTFFTMISQPKQTCTNKNAKTTALNAIFFCCLSLQGYLSTQLKLNESNYLFNQKRKININALLTYWLILPVLYWLHQELKS